MSCPRLAGVNYKRNKNKEVVEGEKKQNRKEIILCMVINTYEGGRGRESQRELKV